MPKQLIKALESEFKKARDPSIVEKQEAYMRNQFRYLGIKKPIQKLIEKPLFKKYPLLNESELVIALEHLWEQEHREYTYSAMSLAYYYRKMWSPAILENFEKMIRQKSWWDTVDEMASRLIGFYLCSFPEEIYHMDRWINDPYLWIRRSAIIFQLHWKQETDEERLFAYCQNTMAEKDFFIRKAIGWALRQYSKTNPDSVQQFIAAHQNLLSPLSRREGSKFLE